jgi:hypothetical protein
MSEVTDLAPIIIRVAVVLVGLSLVMSAMTLIIGLVLVIRGKMKPQDLVLLMKAPTVYLMRQTQVPTRQGEMPAKQSGQTVELRFERYRRQARNYRSN